MDMDKLSELRAECLQCRKCALCETRTNVVFGVGDPEAELLFIGEGPGEQEDKQGEPFVGRAGKLLDTWLEILRLDRGQVYIANMVKCRPPGNRDPLNTEQEACADWLNRQLELIAPKLIVCLGRIAAMTWIRPDFKITKEHGQWFPDGQGRKVMALFHPAALLRDPRKLPDTFEDLKRLEAEIAASCPKTWAVMRQNKETEC
jgi:DNA polymerase